MWPAEVQRPAADLPPRHEVPEVFFALPRLEAKLFEAQETFRSGEKQLCLIRCGNTKKTRGLNPINVLKADSYKLVNTSGFGKSLVVTSVAIINLLVLIS